MYHPFLREGFILTDLKVRYGENQVKGSNRFVIVCIDGSLVKEINDRMSRMTSVLYCK